MCGIFGIVGDGYACVGREEAARTLHHRGPDNFSFLQDHQQQVYLAHCRLSVLDLSINGLQPMANEDGSLWIVFNGEIYGFAALRAHLQVRGHRFRSATDTEVILHAYEEWGIDCLHRLNGMFAFALWDSRQRRLHLIRDRLGIKPLYVASSGTSLAFASDSRALISLPFVERMLEPSALVSYLLHGYVAGRHSIWKGIQRLLPGHRIEVDLTSGKKTEHCWWAPTFQEKAFSFDSCYDEFASCFEQSVADCLVSDVPVGVFLSGGYDSSAIAAAASIRSPQIHGFSIGFQGWEGSETVASRYTAELLGTAYSETHVGDSDFQDLGPILQAFDEPVADSSIFPSYALCALARRHATVALAGDGGDELLAGYRWYQQIVHLQRRKQLAFLASPLIKVLGNHPALDERCDPFAHYRLLTTPSFSLQQIRSLFPWLPQDALPSGVGDLYRSHYQAGLRGYQPWQLIDLKTYMPDCNLMVADRTSMAHSLEIRVPFLDHRLVELVMAFQHNVVARKGEPKRLLARWLAEHGLSHLLYRPKQGFSTPVDRYWPAALMRKAVLDGVLVRSGLLDRQRAEVELERSGGFGLRVLALLDLWIQEWKAV